METILEMRNVRKNYERFALGEMSLRLPGGSVMGLVGPNGSGKTTSIRMMLGMLQPDAGDLLLFGKPWDGTDLLRKAEIGVVLDEPYYIPEWRVSEVEKAMAPFYPAWDSGRFWKDCQRFSLSKDKKVKDLSRGMKVKLMLAVALCHGAKLLILDEPTAGLDPAARDELVDILRDFVVDEEHSVLFSTHITSDLEHIADYITVLQDGTVHFTGEKEDLLSQYMLVKGGAKELSMLREHILGLREYAHGFEGLLPSSMAQSLPAGVVTEGVDIEKILVYLKREEAVT